MKPQLAVHGVDRRLIELFNNNPGLGPHPVLLDEDDLVEVHQVEDRPTRQRHRLPVIARTGAARRHWHFIFEGLA